MKTSGPRKPNFNPESFDESNMRMRNGKYDATDYQATLELRKFIKDNSSDGFITKDQIKQGIGPDHKVNIGGKEVVLNEKQIAAFEKLAADNFSLFGRLDAGTDGYSSHDGVVGVVDANQAIRDSWKLHGSQTSENGYWKDPANSMSTEKAKETLSSFVKKHYGENGVSIDVIKGWSNNHASHNIDDPNVVKAAIVLLKHLDEVNEGGGEEPEDKDFINLAELNAWEIQ